MQGFLYLSELQLVLQAPGLLFTFSLNAIVALLTAMSYAELVHASMMPEVVIFG